MSDVDPAMSDVDTAGRAHTLDPADPEEAGRWMSAFLRPGESDAETAPGSGPADLEPATGPGGGSAADPAAGPATQATDDHSKG
jgi:hypothetical protein